MAKSVRTGNGEGRGRRTSDRRRKTEEQATAEPGHPTASDVRVSFEALSKRGPGTGNGVTREDIARRAYEIYVQRGGTHGYDIEDWLQAERELTGR
jgi:hypothetical protein